MLLLNNRDDYESELGVTCLAWSTQGARLGKAHSSEVAHHVWLTERRILGERSDEDIGFFECVPGYPAEMRLGSLEDTHFVFYLIFGPEDLMYPTRRRRCHGAVLNRRTTRWQGPPTLELMRKDFQERFFKHATAPGSVFFSDTDQERQQHYCELINKRPGQKDARFTLEEMKSWSDQELQQHLFPAGFLSRFQAWKSYRDETHGDDILPFIFDGDHHPGQSAAGTDFPPLLTHGHVIALNRDDSWALATPQEHYKSLGFKFPCALGQVFDLIDAPASTRKKCAGNGMHLMSMACWMAYICANCVRYDPNMIPGVIADKKEQDDKDEFDSEWWG